MNTERVAPNQPPAQHRLMSVEEIERLESDRYEALRRLYESRESTEKLKGLYDDLAGQYARVASENEAYKHRETMMLERVLDLIAGADSYRDEDGLSEIDLQTLAINYRDAARQRVIQLLSLAETEWRRLHRLGECLTCFDAGAKTRSECNRCLKHGLHGCCGPNEDEIRSAIGDQKFDEWNENGRVS